MNQVGWLYAVLGAALLVYVRRGPSPWIVGGLVVGLLDSASFLALWALALFVSRAR